MVIQSPSSCQSRLTIPITQNETQLSRANLILPGSIQLNTWNKIYIKGVLTVSSPTKAQ